MAKLDIAMRDVVSISDAFSTEVNLRRDFYNKKVNLEKLRGYVPNKSSRDAIFGISRGFHPASAKRVHFVTGSYGVGKSHLGLVLANYLSLPIDNKDLQPVMEKIKEKDFELYNQLVSIRSQTKPFIIVIPRAGGDPHGFNHSLLFTLKETLRRVEIDYEPKTNYSTAVDRIKYWKDNEPEAYQKLRDCLRKRDMDIPILKGRLENYDKDAYGLFCKIHYEVAFGAEFLPEGYTVPEDVYADVAKVLRRDYGFQGIVIFYDEFGAYLDQMARDPDGFEGLQLQQFLEYCKRSGEDQCHFIGIAHRSLKDYAEGKVAQEEWKKIFGRFEGTEYYVTFLTEENEMEEMIDSIVLQPTDSKLWGEIKNDSQWDILTDQVQNAGLYPNKNRGWIERVVVKGSFPLHPFSTYCLPWVSERVGQRTRTLFTFFGDELESGLKAFTVSSQVYNGNGRLILFTIDKLFDYFENAIKETKKTAHIYRGYSEAYPYAVEGETAKRVLKTIAVIQVANAPALRTTFEEIVNALYLPSGKVEELRRILGELVDKKALRFRRKTREYLFAKGGEKDVDELIAEETAALRNTFNLIETLNSNYYIGPIEARAYNEKVFANRKAFCQYIFPSSLSNPRQFLQRVEDQYQPNRRKYEGDILVLNVICQSNSDIRDAQKHAQSSYCQDPQLVIAIPKNPVEISEPALHCEAAERLLRKAEAESELKEISEELEEVCRDAKTTIQEILTDFRQASKLSWYRNDGVNPALENGDEENYLSQIMFSLFPDTPSIHHEQTAYQLEGADLMKRHRLEAMKTLLSTKGPIEVKKRGGTAEDAILKASLLENDMLKQVQDKGVSYTYEVIDPPPHSELGKVWDLLSTCLLAKDEEIVPEGIIAELLKPPYGLSHQSIDILLAAFFSSRADQFYLGSNYQSARSKDPSLLQDEKIEAEIIYRLVRNPSDFVLYYYDILPPVQEYLGQLIRSIDPSAQMEEGISWFEWAKSMLLSWYDNIPLITKTSEKFEKKWTGNVISLLKKSDLKPKTMLLEDLPQALDEKALTEWDEKAAQEVVKRFGETAQELNNYHKKVADNILGALGSVFGAAGATDKNFEDAVERWYNNLDESKRMHTFGGDEEILLEQSKVTGAVRDRFLNNLPEKMGLGAYTEWDSDKMLDLFIARIEKAKLRIDTWTPPPPDRKEGINKITEARKRIENTISAIREVLGMGKEEIIKLLEEVIEELRG